MRPVYDINHINITFFVVFQTFNKTFILFVFRRPKTPLKKTGPPTRPKPNINNKDKEPVEVYCRLRPLTNISDLIAVQKVPSNNHLIRLCPPNGSRTELFYKFKHVFDENTSQKQLFENIALSLVTDLINGKNGLFRFFLFNRFLLAFDCHLFRSSLHLWYNIFG